MKNISKLIKRFIGLMMLTSVSILVINFIALAFLVSSQHGNSSPWKMAGQAAECMEKSGQDVYMREDMAETLHSLHVWAVYVDNTTGACIWHSDDLPDTVPLKYTASDIAAFTRGYIDGYPIFTGTGKDGLLLLGYPKDSFWKHLSPSWDYRLIANLPKLLLLVFGLNILAIFFIYMVANTKLLKSLKPISEGILALHTGHPVSLREKGLFSEISANINRASEVLQEQKQLLKKKEMARANWIAGISHDIRTPLSMVMGYAHQLEGSPHLSEEERQRVEVIAKQSQRMKNLINDLNLVSRLEYTMQPVRLRRINLLSAVRQVVADFINLDIHGNHPIHWVTNDDLRSLMIEGDEDLLKRAVSNLIQNSITHNPSGCSVYVSVEKRQQDCTVLVADNGRGVTQEQLDRLNNAPHYMSCEEDTTLQRHGLGLLIVKQIAAVHKGRVLIRHSTYGGLEVRLCLPLLSEDAVG